MKALLGILATALTLSVSYYFAIALPAHNRALLEFEREKYRTAQEEKTAKEKEEKDLRASADQEMFSCKISAEAEYSKNLKLNGTPNAHGFSVPTTIQAVIERQRTQAINECQREFERQTKTAH